MFSTNFHLEYWSLTSYRFKNDFFLIISTIPFDLPQSLLRPFILSSFWPWLQYNIFFLLLYHFRLESIIIIEDFCIMSSNIILWIITKKVIRGRIGGVMTVTLWIELSLYYNVTITMSLKKLQTLKLKRFRSFSGKCFWCFFRSVSGNRPEKERKQF